jgi:TetR/AcrR family transcriptional regulator, transcriptional repressor of bet genes
MARPSNSPSRRAEIVAAALAVVAKTGFTAATTAQIAQAAGLAPGLIHYHFKDKREILLALVAELVATARARFDARAVGQNAQQQLDAWIDARLALGADASPAAVAAWAMIACEAIVSADVREVYQATLATEIKLVEKLLRAVCAERGKRAHQLSVLAANALTYVEGSFLLASATPNLLPTGHAAASLKAWMDAAISALRDR